MSRVAAASGGGPVRRLGLGFGGVCGGLACCLLRAVVAASASSPTSPPSSSGGASPLRGDVGSGLSVSLAPVVPAGNGGRRFCGTRSFRCPPRSPAFLAPPPLLTGGFARGRRPRAKLPSPRLDMGGGGGRVRWRGSRSGGGGGNGGGDADDDSSSSSSSLEWETFDFSKNPKQDVRFDNSVPLYQDPNNQHRSYTDEEMSSVISSETRLDREAAEAMSSANEAYDALVDLDLLDGAAELLGEYVTDERRGRIEGVLAGRTGRTRFLFENPSNPSNVWACLRTIDSFGVQNVDLVVDSSRYVGKSALNQKRGMRTAMGSAKWLTLTNHGSTGEALRHLRDDVGCAVLAADVNPTSTDVRDVDWDALLLDDGGGGDQGGGGGDGDGRPVCICMGNEERGISDELRDASDGTFFLPMVGFAESFNLSVATAVTLAHMSAASSCGGGTGPLRPGDLGGAEVRRLRLRWLLGSMPRKRGGVGMGAALLRRGGIDLPEEVLDSL